MKEFVYNTADSASNLTDVSISNPKYKPYLLVDENDCILKKETKPFSFSDLIVDPEDIGFRLVETAKFHNTFCVTANQVGLDCKVFVAGSGDNFVAFYNPEILTYSAETSVTQETDLSNMGFILQVKRPTSISIQYEDYTGETKIAQFDGLTARIIQQCVDRLNGVDFKTKVSKLVLDRAKLSLDKRIKKFVKYNTYVKK